MKKRNKLCNLCLGLTKNVTEKSGETEKTKRNALLDLSKNVEENTINHDKHSICLTQGSK